MEQISKAELLGGEISCNTTPNYLCVPSAEILKVVLIETDLVGMPGLKDEWKLTLLNAAEYVIM